MPHTAILATSREPLMIQGERNYPVNPLAVRIGDASPAAELFIDRARANGAEIDPARDGKMIAEICQGLDGLCVRSHAFLRNAVM
jgi:predicted ATPase